MDLIHPDVDRYLADLAATPDPVLREMEALGAQRDFPIVGPQVGRLLCLLAMGIGARRVLELGSGFGYSAWWFAQAVGPEGEVILTEGDAARCREAESFLARAGLLSRVRIEHGSALDVADRVRGTVDVVFNDSHKREYPQALARTERLIRPGGLFISDNMLWRGSVLDAEDADADTRGVLELTRVLYDHPDFFTTLLPVRDGVTVSIRRA